MFLNFQSLSVSAMTWTLCLAVQYGFAAEDAATATHDGKVVSISSTSLVMKTKTSEGVKEHSHMLPTNAKVTLDGKVCLATDLKPGMKIRVTTASGDAKAVTQIEAIDKNALFAHMHDGTVSSVTSSSLVMDDQNGKEHTHAISPATKIHCDGKVCKATDLKPGMKIRVTTGANSKSALICIEAIEKNPEFAAL